MHYCLPSREFEAVFVENIELFTHIFRHICFGTRFQNGYIEICGHTQIVQGESRPIVSVLLNRSRVSQ